MLDEPTNHLDVDSREALIHALNDYEGAVILISHDRHLTGGDGRPAVGGADGTVKVYDGDLETYRTERLAAARDRKKPKAGAKEVVKDTSKEARRASAERRAELAPLKKQLQDAEKRIAQLNAKIASIDTALGDAALYARDPAKAQALTRERGEIVKAVALAEEEWLELSEVYEEAAKNVA